MLENDSCFICLDECNNRICTECKCFAHVNCFAEYINKKIILNSQIDHVDEMFKLRIYTYIDCPVCKKEIKKHNKRITRSRTYNHRLNYTTYILNYYLDLINNDETDDIVKLDCLLDSLLKMVVKYKNTILNNDKFNKVIKKKLMKINENWPKANLYHYELYGIQIQD